ncbi:MAG: DUF5685 family protein [Peptostreptococcus sp.]|uniref:DUF5685 family protein n=1 Tax=Peptostreptococcus sp. TaxID=1262 RepID=UPI002FCB07EF
MFGYVRINKMDLTFREYEHYKAYYCGLCKSLKRDHTEISRLSINYDITFLVLILTSIYQPKSEIYYERCIVNPIKKKKHMSNEFTEYAAAMNILLTYYKLEDDVEDRGNLGDKLARGVFNKSFKSAYEKYPQKAEAIKSHLEELSKLERKNSNNIDKTSNTFGELMKDIFIYREDEYSVRLGELGFNIGKYIYIMDAYEDLDKDLETGEYNPFKECKDDREFLKKRVDRLIMMCLSRLENAIVSLDIKVNNGIINNIIYSGVYLRYKGVMNKNTNEKNMK